MNATLIRHPKPGRTFGVLVLDNGWTCQTLERPWLGNRRNESCIPTSDMNEPFAIGEYTVIPHKSPSRGDCFAVLDVPNRTDILIHAGNTVDDTQGCILVGFRRKADRIEQSRAALQELREQAPDGFKMVIVYAA